MFNSKTVSKLCALALLLALLLGLVKTVAAPVDEIYYENRPASKLASPTLSAFLSGELQDNMEQSLSDQIPLAIKLKKLYNIFCYHSAEPVINSLSSAGSRYIRYKNTCIYNDALVNTPPDLQQQAWRLHYYAELINSYAADCPETEFYVYYIEHDADIDFSTGCKSGFFDYLSSSLALEPSHISSLCIDSFDDYEACFLKTDHHWNAAGAHRALLDICDMLGVPAPECLGVHTVSGRYHGTRSAGLEGFHAEDFSVYIYDYPDMDIFINGNKAVDYGRRGEFIMDSPDSFSYGSVYGTDNAETEFVCGTDGTKLLVMSDSYDNALIKPLAASFAHTYSVDLRAYALDVDGSFDMAEYISAHDIDKVIFIGALEYFNGSSC